MSEDIAVLGFEVDTSDIKQARDELGRFEAQAKRTETSAERMERMATRAFRAIGGAAASLLRQINSMGKAWSVYEIATAAASGSTLKLTGALVENGHQFTKHEQQVSRSSKALGLFKTALAVLGISLGVSQMIQYTDTYGSLRGQIALTTESTREMNKTWRDLYMVSQQTAQSLKGTVELYSRMARSSKELQLTQTELVSITDTINKTLLISRTPAASAEAALFQLSQAMASGVLRGEELNSVMEQAPRLALALANGLGVPIGELRKMGAEGELTAKKVIGALQQQKQYIDQEFSGVFVSVSNAMARVDNTLVDLVGRADEAAGASAVFGKAIADVITRLESGEAINSTTKALEVLTVGLSLGAKALVFFIDNLDIFIGLWAAGKLVGAIFSATAAINAFSVGSRAATAAAGALGVTLGTTSKAMAGFGAAIALTNPLTALIGLISAAAAVYLLFASNATAAQEAETSFNKTIMESGKNAQEYIAYLKELNQTKKEALALKYSEELEKERDVLAGLAGDIKGELGGLYKLSPMAERTGMLNTDADRAAMDRFKQINAELAKMQKGDISSDQLVDRLVKIAESAGVTGTKLEALRGEVVKTASQMQDSAERAGNYQARIELIKDPTNRAAQATIGLINSVQGAGDALSAQSEEWGKYIGKLITARDTIGKTKTEEVAYEAARKGFTAERIAYAVAVSQQVEGLNKYEKALQDNDKAEAAAAKTSLMRLSEIEASAVRGMVIAEEMAKLGEMVAKGIITQIEAARMATTAGEAAYKSTLEESKARLQGILDTLDRNTKPGKSIENEAQKQADALKEYVQQQELAIGGALKMADAYAKGDAAVREVTQQLKIEEEVLKLGEKARSKVVELVKAENDARDKRDIAQSISEMRMETAEQNKYATAILAGKKALAAYNLEKQIAAATAGKNAAAVKAEAEELRKAAEANSAANRRVEDAQELVRLVDQTANAQEKYNERVKELDRLSKSASTPEQVEAIRRSLEQAKYELIEAQNQLDPMAQKFASIASEIEDGFKESFVSSFEEGENAFAKMADGMKSIFKRLLAELAYQALVKPILMPVLQGVGTGLFGMSSGNTSQILQSVLGNVTGGTAGVGGGAGGSSWLSTALSAFGTRNSGGGGGLGGFFSGLFGGGSTSNPSALASQYGPEIAKLGGLGGGGGGGGAGALGTLSNLSSLYGYGKSFITGGGLSGGVSGAYNGLVNAFGGNSIGAGISQAGGWLSGTSALQGPTMAGGNISGGMFSNAGSISNLAYAGYGIAGGYIGDWVGSGKYSGMLGSGGAIVGAAAGASSAAMGATFGSFAGPVGALAGAIIGGLVGSLFGSSKKLKEQGVIANFTGDEMTDGQQYQVWEKKKLFGGKKKSYKYFALPDGFMSDINESLGGVGDYVADVGETAGVDIASRLSTVKERYRGSPSGLTKWLDGYVDKLFMAAAPNLDAFKNKDESTRDAFARLETIFKNYNEIKGSERTDIDRQVESLDAALAEAKRAFEAIAAPASKIAEIEQTRAGYLRKLADEMELAAKQAKGLTMAQQKELDLQAFDKQAANTRSDAALVGADMTLINEGIAAQRQSIIDQFNIRQRGISIGLDQRELTTQGLDREAAVLKLKEQQQLEREAAQAAGYSAEQLSRLASVLAGEFAEAIRQMDRAMQAGNLDIGARLAAAQGIGAGMQDATLASFDFKAVEELEQARRAGLDVLKLEQAIALERKKLVEDYYNAIRDGNAANQGTIVNQTGTMADRLAFNLSEFDIGAARQIQEATNAGLNMELVRRVLDLQREAIMKETDEAIRAVDMSLRMRELNLGGKPMDAQREQLIEQQRLEMDMARAAGYSADQLARLAAVLNGEFADAVKQLQRQTEAKNLDINARLANLEGRELDALMMVFDDRARQELEEAKRLGADVVTLEKVLGLERLKVIDDFNKQALEQQKALSENYRDWLDSQLLSGTSTLTPEQRLLEAQRQFDDNLAKARGGDLEAQGSVTQYADQLLQIGRDFYASSDQYTQMAEFIRKTVENLGAQLQLPGFAGGTRNAPRGLAWTGEDGPELVDFSGGERVYTAEQSARMASMGSGGGDTREVVKAVVVTGAEQTEALGQVINLLGEMSQEINNLRREFRRAADKPK